MPGRGQLQTRQLWTTIDSVAFKMQSAPNGGSGTYVLNRCGSAIGGTIRLIADFSDKQLKIA
jgi:hypothetical protein